MDEETINHLKMINDTLKEMLFLIGQQHIAICRLNEYLERSNVKATPVPKKMPNCS